VVTKIKVADNHGIKKKESALARKIANQDVVKALNDCPSSPRKMRFVADIIRGEK
jgi:large subunit ribosomal protein L22